MVKNDNSNGNEKKRNNQKTNNMGWAKKNQQKKEYFKKNAERFETQGSWRRESLSLDPSQGSFRCQQMQDHFGVKVDPIETTTDEDDSNANANANEATVRGKKKVAMLVAFCGSQYSGFQINPLTNSIQAQLELALYRAHLIIPTNFGYPHKYGWSTSARTDKGVHAVAQVCSAKLELGELSEEEVRNRINEELPTDIRVMDIKRTTRGFCAKSQRTKVRYQYMIPSFLFYPKDDLQTLFKGIGYPNNGQLANEPLTTEEVNQVKPELTKYKATSQNLKELQAALSQFCGTKPYHNFTKNMKVGDKAANRYILDFSVDTPFLMDDGTEWIPTRVTGQAFLFNQIRKMISMAVDVARGVATPEQLGQALGPVQIRTGLAPAQGLFLEMSDFSGYNENKRNEDLPELDWMQNPDSDAMQRHKTFRDDYILKHIGKEEAEEANFIKYLYNMEFLFTREKNYTPHEVGSTHSELNDEDDNPVVESDHDEEPRAKVAKVEEPEEGTL